MPKYIDVEPYIDCRIVANSEDKGIAIKDIPICKPAQDIINRQKAEIEKLQNTIIALEKYLNILGIDKTDTSIIVVANELNKQIRKDVKSEAYKEFAERLKEHKNGNYVFVSVELIDRLLKEMVGKE